MADWSYFNKFQRANDMYLPSSGEGDTVATQIVTAVSKLVYKWYNDGDVYDNTYGMDGWCNDLSSYANWLYKYVPVSQHILDRISDCFNEKEYEDILKDLADACLDDEDLEIWNQSPKVGSIYSEDGPFEFREDYDDESEYEYEEEEYWDDEEEEY